MWKLDRFYRATRMLARYMLSLCVRPSVRPSQAGVVSKLTTGRIEVVFGMVASFHCAHTVLQGNLGSSKLGYFSLELCTKLRT